MSEGVRNDVSDGVSWKCPKCSTRKSIREGSFFSKSRLTLKQWVIVIYWWGKQYPVGQAGKEAQTSQPSAINIYQWLREVCSTKLVNDPMLLGGPGVVVQVDESAFTHKPKVYNSCIHNYT